MGKFGNVSWVIRTVIVFIKLPGPLSKLEGTKSAKGLVCAFAGKTRNVKAGAVEIGTPRLAAVGA